MWNKLTSTQLFLSCPKHDARGYEVYLTDYVSIWFNRYAPICFLTALKDSNDGLELEEEILIEHGTKILTHPEDLKDCKFFPERDKYLIVILSMKFGSSKSRYTVKLRMQLCEGSKELFFQQVTQPMLKTVQDLLVSERRLRQLLQKKDDEIEEYKCEGGEIALRHLKTVPFNDELHLSKHTAYWETFGSNDICEVLRSKTVDIPATTHLDIKQETAELNRNEPAVRTELETKVDQQAGESELQTQVKREADQCESQSIKSEPQSIKSETQSESLSYRPMVSPQKSKRKKLNL